MEETTACTRLMPVPGQESCILASDMAGLPLLLSVEPGKRKLAVSGC